jgi:hypothetical protein
VIFTTAGTPGFGISVALGGGPPENGLVLTVLFGCARKMRIFWKKNS